MQKTNEPSLRRAIGPVSLALNAINLTVGAGIFVLPATVAAGLGPAAFIAYLVCGLLVVLIMLCYAEVGSRVVSTGGSYAYVEKAFGPLAGFLVNSLFWIGFAAASNAAVANALTDMLALWFPVFSLNYVKIIFFSIVFSLLAFINIRGVKEGANFASVVTLIKIMPLLLLVIIGLFSISSPNLAVKTWPAIKSIGDASLILFFAFMGTETALSVSGEVKEPGRNIPKGIFLGVAGVLIIYLLIQFVAQGVLGEQLAVNKNAPLAALATNLIGPAGGSIILATSVLCMFGMVTGDLLASPRVLFAAAEDKLLPGFLARVHPAFATPYWAIIAYSFTCFIFSSSGGFRQLAVLASASVLIIYLSVVLATIRLRYKKGVHNTGSFKMPGGLTIPVLAILTISWFLSYISKAEIKAILIFFAVATAFYFVYKYCRSIFK
jgi:APA family basic amino acid/polyamine antiporter